LISAPLRRRRQAGATALQLAISSRKVDAVGALMESADLWRIVEVEELAQAVFDAVRADPGAVQRSQDSKGRPALNLATGVCRQRMFQALYFLGERATHPPAGWPATVCSVRRAARSAQLRRAARTTRIALRSTHRAARRRAARFACSVQRAGQRHACRAASARSLGARGPPLRALRTGRYELLNPGNPKHRSATCVVLFALDHGALLQGGTQPESVVLKYMRNTDQWERELRLRGHGRRRGRVLLEPVRVDGPPGGRLVRLLHRDRRPGLRGGRRGRRGGALRAGGAEGG
jgi:hypothetical protein